jgi:hypothetical protein
MNRRGSSSYFLRYPHRRKGKHMGLEQIKYYTLDDDEDAILVTDIDETTPETDDDGNLQYYSMSGHYVFSVNEDE